MVQSIETLEPNLQVLSIGEGERLVESEVELIQGWLAYAVAAADAVLPVARLHEACGVEPFRGAACEASRRVADFLRHEGAYAARICRVGRRDRDRKTSGVAIDT